ncbi:hypothetical protein EJ04DRAFT_577271 [Polyplosphaeria fusca]|uniref:Uncharacterized protein n=1 Tax=Polyplosphaeria fusca TaxID=682080 RepID=A0A9P4QZA9_9PLEO|nr:hypothetical protein EJ04DRAFT_577271 [Polyplosphaeria fusca]
MPHFRRSSKDSSPPSSTTLALEQARAAARSRRDIYVQIRAHLGTLYPQYPRLLVRTQQSVGVGGNPCYVSLVLYEAGGASTRLTRTNPVIGYGDEYYDDRLVQGPEGFTVLVQGTPGADQSEGMRRLLERVALLVRSGWRSSG